MSHQSLSALGHVTRELDAAVERLLDLEMAHAQAECEFVVAKARSFLEAQGSVSARGFVADVETNDQMRAFKTSGARLRAHREHIRALHARIDVGRTVVTTERKLSGVS